MPPKPPSMPSMPSMHACMHVPVRTLGQAVLHALLGIAGAPLVGQHIVGVGVGLGSVWLVGVLNGRERRQEGSEAVRRKTTAALCRPVSSESGPMGHIANHSAGAPLISSRVLQAAA